MKATLEWDGMDEIKRDLLALPEDLAREAAQAVVFTASACAGEIRAAYPVHSGNLRGGVRSKTDRAGGTVTATIISAAPHAWIYERGTKIRRTKQGWNRGQMPAGHVFFPTVATHRRRLYDAFVAIVERAGFDILGRAA